MAKNQMLLHCFWEGCPIFNDITKFETKLRRYCKIVSKNPDWDTCPESKGKYYSIRYSVTVRYKDMFPLGQFLLKLPHGLHHYRFL